MITNLWESREMVDSSPLRAVTEAWAALCRICFIAIERTRGVEAASEWAVHLNMGDPTLAIPQLHMIGLRPEYHLVFVRLALLEKQARRDGLDAVTPLAARDFIDTCLALTPEIITLPIR
ncbi:hypothetical protein [Peterkaempfera griseoplana]|uniref:hypothetical protein n=1 Tax=Peterkaempfera griseoplana TaxID=66896 RepID=UPI0006E2C82B|nr:hypothetical protein [Peterkaempfera griseoplana]